MMQNNLFLNRLIIMTEDGETAYDEFFHKGVNIIHGQNSSGKSTIIRFIFFVLGGSYGDFVPEALRCQYVMAEVSINGIVYTLKRYLEKTDDGTKVKKTAPLYIYFGSIEECVKDQRSDKWHAFGYNTMSNRRSFSNVLFELMGLPEVKEGSNITMHQILRLIYLDQESPLSSLFFFEQFDQSITRETVAELLMGLYDEQLSDAKLYRLELKERIDELKQNIKIIDEKAPKNKEDMKLLRNTRIKFTEEENDCISRYIFWMFWQFYDEANDTYDLNQIKSFVEDYFEYQKLVVRFTAEHLYSDYNKIKINDDQKLLFREAVVNWLNDLAGKPCQPEPRDRLQPIMVLLHHDVNVDDEMVLRLLPYSYCYLYVRTEGYNGYNYSLFDYACERYAGRQTELLNALRNVMDQPVDYPVQNWKDWCIFLIKKGISSEYDRVVNIMLSLPCEDPAICIAQALIDNEDTRPMVLMDDILERCGAEKRLFIYEHLSPDAKMDVFVRDGIEKDFDALDEGYKCRAVRLLLLKGSVKGLEYVEGNIHVIDMGWDFRKYDIAALPLLMKVYSKAIDNLRSSYYGGILNAVGAIAGETDEGWARVNEVFAELIEKDEKKFRHLNWYLRDWSVKRMEQDSPIMSIEEVKCILS